MATRDEIASFLETAGCGTVGTSLFKGQLPPSTSTSTTVGAVIEYGGLPPTHVFGTGTIALEYPRVQIVFRGGTKNDYATPATLAETAYEACAAAANQDLDSTRYLTLQPLQPPFLIDKDDNERCLVGFNVQVIKELSA